MLNTATTHDKAYFRIIIYLPANATCHTAYTAISYDKALLPLNNSYFVPVSHLKIALTQLKSIYKLKCN